MNAPLARGRRERARARTRFNLTYIPGFDGINGHAPVRARFPSISGAAVPEETLLSNAAVHARAREADALLRAMRSRDALPGWNAARARARGGRDGGGIPGPCVRAIPRREDPARPIEASPVEEGQAS